MIAVAAINRSASARFKRNLGFFAALSTSDSIHLPVRRRGICLVDFFFLGLSGFAGSPGGTTSGTTLWGMIMSFSAESLLFFDCEDVRITAVMTR